MSDQSACPDSGRHCVVPDTMLALIRLLKTFLRAARLPTLDPHATCVTQWRVLPGDIDAFGHMNNGRYQSLMDIARVDFLLRCDLFRGVVQSIVYQGESLLYEVKLDPGDTVHIRLPNRTKATAMLPAVGARAQLRIDRQDTRVVRAEG